MSNDSTPVGQTSSSQQSTPTSFPEEAFVGSFASYRSLVGGTTESPDSFIWGAFAAALSVLVGRNVMLKSGIRDVVANLIVVLLGVTALPRKSTSMDDVIAAVVEPLKPRPTQPSEPDPLEINVGQGSGEGFIDAVADKTWLPKGATEPLVMQGRRALFVVHELGELFGKVRRDQAGCLIDTLINLYDARPTQTIRTKGRAVTVTNGLGVVLAATTTEGMVQALTAKTVSSGLLNRMLVLSGDRKAPIPIRPPLDQAQHAAFLQEFASRLQAVWGKTLTLDPEAQQLQSEHYIEEYNRVGSELKLAATRRADGIALKIAMLLAVSEGTTTITWEHVDAAWRVVEYSRAAVEALLERIPESDWREAENRVLEKAMEIAMSQNGMFRERQLFQRLKGRTGMPGATFRRAFATHVEMGEFVPVQNYPGWWMLSPEPQIVTTSQQVMAPAAPPVSPVGNGQTTPTGQMQ